MRLEDKNIKLQIVKDWINLKMNRSIFAYLTHWFVKENAANRKVYWISIQQNSI